MGIVEGLGRALRLPSEAVTDLPVIRAVGGREATIENHKGIIAYSPEEAKVRVKGGCVAVSGSSLVITSLRAQSVAVTGAIRNIAFYF